MDEALATQIRESMRSREPVSLEERFKIWSSSDESKGDEEGFVSFGAVARILCGQQCQYVSRYVLPAWQEQYLFLGKGLHFKNLQCFSDLLIHKDDVEEFMSRYTAMQKKSTRPF
jgi:hypothetical protein